MRMCTCEHVRVHVHVHLCARVMRFRLGIIAMRIWVQARVVGHALGGHGSLASTTALAVDAVRSAGGDATAGGAVAATGVVASRFFGAGARGAVGAGPLEADDPGVTAAAVEAGDLASDVLDDAVPWPSLSLSPSSSPSPADPTRSLAVTLPPPSPSRRCWKSSTPYMPRRRAQVTMAVTRVVLIGMTATRTVAVRGESRRKRTGIGCSAWQTERIAMRETFCLARSLSPVHIILPEDR